jgi:Ca-activated chloride channel family protein
VKEGTNRVILCTDGDFNVGITDNGSLTRLIEEKAKSGVFLTVMGFGMGNVKDATMEQLADKGNGNYSYIDNLNEARKVLVEQMTGTLLTIAKDVKIQVEFNPARVANYRLIGYENRILAARDFHDDTKDAGEIGAGHSVTALYEIVPVGKELKLPAIEALKYQKQAPLNDSPESLTVKLRYKAPDGDVSRLIEVPVTDNGQTFEKSSDDLRWSAAVAGFGMLLRSSPHKGDFNYKAVLEIATGVKGTKDAAYRAEFRQLVERAADLSKK